MKNNKLKLQGAIIGLTLLTALTTHSAIAQTKVVVIPIGSKDISTCVDNLNTLNCGSFSSFRIPVNRSGGCLFGSFNIDLDIRYLGEANSKLSFFQNKGSAPRIEIRYSYSEPIINPVSSTYSMSFNNGSTTEVLSSDNHTFHCVAPRSQSIGVFTAPNGTQWRITPSFDVNASSITFIDLLFERLP